MATPGLGVTGASLVCCPQRHLRDRWEWVTSGGRWVALGPSGFAETTAPVFPLRQLVGHTREVVAVAVGGGAAAEGPGLESTPLVNVEAPVRFLGSLPMVGWAAWSVPGQAPSPEPVLRKRATGLQDTLLPGSACSDLSQRAGQGVEASPSSPFGLRALEPSPPSWSHHIPFPVQPLQALCSSLPQGLCTCCIIFKMHFPRSSRSVFFNSPFEFYFKSIFKSLKSRKLNEIL